MNTFGTTGSEAEGAFGRTQWSAVLRVARQSEDATEAFERLAKAYWRPLYEFLCRNGHQPVDAKDLVQDFFAFLMNKKPLGSVDPAKGRFRSYLLGVLRHFMANRRVRQNAQKRGGGNRPLPLEDLSPDLAASAELSIDCSPDEVFDADWGETLVSHALTQLQAEYETGGRINVFQKLISYLNPSGDQAAYAAVAQELAMNEDAVKMAVARLRRRFRALLRARIAETVSNEEDVADEYRYLTRVLTHRRAN